MLPFKSLVASFLLASQSGVDPLNLTDQQLSETLDLKIRSAQVVAIGESVRGSSNFIKLQHRLAQYLIQKKQFRTIIIELPLLRARGLNDWVQGCAGQEPPGEAPLDLLYTPTQDDQRFWNWLCEHNRENPKNPIVVRGMDIWDRPWEFQAHLTQANEELKLGWDAEIQRVRQHCVMHGESDWSRYAAIYTQIQNQRGIAPSDLGACVSNLNRLLSWAESRIAGARGIRKFKLQSVAQVIVEARGWQRFLDAKPQGEMESWIHRSEAQAYLIQAIFEQEGSERAILLAHTSGVAKNKSSADWWRLGVGTVRSAVSFFKDRFFSKVVSLGLTAYDASGTRGVFEKPTALDSLDRVLFEANYRLAAIDPESVFVRQRERWWIQNENSKDHYPDGVYLIPRDHFDLLFFVGTTPAGEAILPWREFYQW